MNKKELVSKAKKRAVVVAIFAFIPVYILVWIISGVIYFSAGGTLGGYGAAGSPGDASWQTPAWIADYIFGLLLLFFITLRSYRSYIRKHST